MLQFTHYGVGMQQRFNNKVLHSYLHLLQIQWYVVIYQTANPTSSVPSTPVLL